MKSEALLSTATRGLVPPSRFIPIAERSGLITEVGAWVLNEACQQMQLWRSMGLADL